jgi:hypothetical protein
VRNAMVPLAGHPNLLVTVWTFDAYCRTASGPGAAADREERIGRAFDQPVQGDAGTGAGARAGVRCRSLIVSAAPTRDARAAGDVLSAGLAP